MMPQEQRILRYWEWFSPAGVVVRVATFSLSNGSCGEYGELKKENKCFWRIVFREERGWAVRREAAFWADVSVRILGIDPGTAICGWAVVEKDNYSSKAVDYGAIVTPSSMDASQRLELIYANLLDIIERYEPQYGAVEKLFFGQNTKTALAVGQARGVTLLALRHCKVPMVEMAPSEVKQTVTGYGRADKHQVQIMVARLLHLSQIPTPDDAADALAIAMTGIEWVRYQEVLRD
jgi:crossover junction endodeoxyribonuclease RuvC